MDPLLIAVEFSGIKQAESSLLSLFFRANFRPKLKSKATTPITHEQARTRFATYLHVAGQPQPVRLFVYLCV